jgi:ABC-2 type transport system permease protein
MEETATNQAKSSVGTKHRVASQKQIIKSLLRADALTQRRQSRSALMSSVLAIIILITWRQFASQGGAAGWQHILLATCISIVLIGLGILGYPTMMARDRDNGVFQRLRVTPATTSSIMFSRLALQAVIMGILSLIIMVVAAAVDRITLSPIAYILTFFISVFGGVMYLSIGQVLVALITSQGTLNAVGRVIYFPLIFIGGLAELGIIGHVTKTIFTWLPYGTVQSLLQAAMQPSKWGAHASIALVVTLAYMAVFTAVGVRYFRWTSKP